jgi:hypothetical protein
MLTLAECCPLLETVEFCGCKQVGDKEMVALVRGCPKLASLDIFCTSVTEHGLCAIREHCTALQSITLDGRMFPGGEFDGAFFPLGVGISSFCEESWSVASSDSGSNSGTD